MEHAMDWIGEDGEVAELALFVDFDGTLAPIVERPDDARPLEGVVELLEELAGWIPVGVISGRALGDVSSRLGADGVYYAGSHGLEIEGEDGQTVVSEDLEALKDRVDEVDQQLRSRFSEVPRVEIERKPYSVAVHFRRRPEAREIVEKAVEEVVAAHEGFEMEVGDMVREFQPDIEADKGTALRALLERIDPDGRRTPVYVGDDTTDEDAFEEIGDRGVGILVAEQPRESAARYLVEGPHQVRQLLEVLARRLREEADPV